MGALGGTFSGTGRVTFRRTSFLSPNSTCKPSLSMSSLLTAAMALGRWAITTTQDFFLRRISIALASAASPSASRLELGSSSTTRGGFPRTARASAMRCTWPPERTCIPCDRSVEYPSGNLRISSCTPASFAASTTCSSEIPESKRAMLSRTVPGNSSTVCGR